MRLGSEYIWSGSLITLFTHISKLMQTNPISTSGIHTKFISYNVCRGGNQVAKSETTMQRHIFLKFFIPTEMSDVINIYNKIGEHFASGRSSNINHAQGRAFCCFVPYRRERLYYFSFICEWQLCLWCMGSSTVPFCSIANYERAVCHGEVYLHAIAGALHWNFPERFV